MGPPQGGRGGGQSFDHRDLKDGLGGAIFGCIDKTYRECVEGLVFGLPAGNMRWVKYVASGMPIFLFNYNTKMLHGMFVATTSGQMNISPRGWTSVSNTQETRYPAQVKVKLLERCAAMPERQFSKYIEGAYFAHGKFSYQLTHDEAMALCKAFSPQAYQTLMQAWEEQACLGTNTPAMSWEQEKPRPQVAEGWEEQASVGTSTPAMSWEQEQPRPQIAESQSKGARASEMLKSIKQEGWDSSSPRSESPVGSGQFSGGRQSGSTTPSTSSQPQQAMPKPAPGRPTPTATEAPPRQSATQKERHATTSGAARTIILCRPHASESILMMGGSVPSPSHPWIDTVDALDPATGVCFPLFSLPEHSAYGAAAKMGSDVFYIGGGKGTSWSRQCLKAKIGGPWQHMPEMHRGRGSLMAAVHDGSLWAIGGRDAAYHSSTERLDLASGQWVTGPEMHTQRFACAGGMLGAGIIVTGGFDGMEYQRSVERLDPRMKRSMEVAEMTQARGTHSCVLLNGILYAAGGWALSSALKQFERYDERADKWEPLSPMHETRSYLAAAACNGKVFALGGLRLSGDQAIYSASVEVYDPARDAWSYLDLPETFIKKRAFASAISVH